MSFDDKKYQELYGPPRDLFEPEIKVEVSKKIEETNKTFLEGLKIYIKKNIVLIAIAILVIIVAIISCIIFF